MMIQRPFNALLVSFVLVSPWACGGEAEEGKNVVRALGITDGDIARGVDLLGNNGGGNSNNNGGGVGISPGSGSGSGEGSGSGPDGSAGSGSGGGVSCLETQCGAQISSCGQGCVDLLNCVGACSDQSCAQSCSEQASPEAYQQASNLVGCYQNSCSEPVNNNAPQDDFEVCAQQQCGSEVAACGSECRAVDACIAECDDDACVNHCVQGASQAAVEQLSAAYQCLEQCI